MSKDQDCISSYRINTDNCDKKLTDLQIRLRDVLEIQDIISACSVDLNKKDIHIYYSKQLTTEQYNVLANIVSIIFNGNTSKDLYQSNRIIVSDKIPSKYCDMCCGYNIGTMCISPTKNLVYICTNNSKDAAVWGLLLQKSPRTPRSIKSPDSKH